MRTPETLEALARRIRVARGLEPADLLLVNGKVLSTFTGEVLETAVAVAEGRVAALGDPGAGARETVDLGGAFLAPAFTDAHIHVESSLLTPEGFAEAVVPHGTGAVVSDPHEIANVAGMEGMAYMKAAASSCPMDFLFTVPSCVPATSMESAGAELGPEALEEALDRFPEAPALSEMMNFPGVLLGDGQVLRKIAAALGRGKAVDGHSPGLSGPDLDAYLGAGIATDHECLTAGEAREKMRRGMWLFAREGSAARNLEALLPAVDRRTASRLCLVSDDRHPEDLVEEGHLDAVLRKAVALGLDPLDALRAVTLNPALVYGLADRGGIAPGYLADLAVLEDLRAFRVREVYHRGRVVAREGSLLSPLARLRPPFPSRTVLPTDLGARLAAYPREGTVRVIGAQGAQIVTSDERGEASRAGAGDLQFAAVVERHRGTGNVGLGFVRGFGLERGALASTVAHDSHNLVLVGTSAEEMALAAQAVAERGGGQAVARGREVLALLPLEVGGLMSLRPAREVVEELRLLHRAAAAIGCRLPAPFMTLSFLALPVIPALKLTDRGLIDVSRFEVVPLEAS
ncbi:MAG: adenine deaminase [Acidobacteriota bacterium]